MNAPHHRAAANRPELKERRGRRLRVHVVVMPHDIDKVAFEGPNTPDRGYTMRVSYLKPPANADALVEVMKNGEKVREFLFPAYKIYNLQAHFSEIVDSEIEKNDNGYRQAAWTGIGPV